MPRSSKPPKQKQTLGEAVLASLDATTDPKVREWLEGLVAGDAEERKALGIPEERGGTNEGASACTARAERDT